jgi:hypothetical protein
MNDTILNISKDLKRLATSIEKLAKETYPTREEDTAAPAPEEITLEEVRAKLAALMQAGKQAEVKKLLKKHGGNKLSDVPKKNYQALIKDAEAV